MISVRTVPLVVRLLLAVGLFAVPQQVLACGSTCKPPICGKTMSFAKAPPSHPLLLTDGGTFMLPVTVYAATTAGCSSTPTSVAITITLTCNGGGNGSGTLTTAIAPGYNDLMVPVDIPAGPPRICTVTGTATVTFSDGMMLSNEGDTVVCIVEPAPTMPSLPRLDMQLLTPTINRKHPGDQYLIQYEVTNNDPLASFSGNFRVGIENAATMPIDLGPGANGEGVFGVADPAGDHPPIYFLSDIEDPLCVPLPRDPHLTLPNETVKPITLDPGETLIIDVVSRHWGLCASGTCSESIAVFEGLFSDTTEGLACSGTVLAVDPTIPPQWLWDGAGQAALAMPFDPANGIGRFVGQLSDGTPINLDIFLETFEVNGLPPNPMNAFDYMDPLDPFELRGQFYLQQPLLPNDPLTGISQLFVFGDGVQPIPQGITPHLGAPTGFSQLGPFFTQDFILDLPPFDGLPDGHLTLLTQISMVGFSGTQFLPNEPIEIFTDGFESGNVTAWSRSVESGGGLDGVQVFFDMRAYIFENPAPFPCPPDVTADFDGDGLVTTADLNEVVAVFFQENTTNRDRNGDGRIDVRDMVVMVDKVGCQEVAATVAGLNP